MVEYILITYYDNTVIENFLSKCLLWSIFSYI